MPVDHLFGSFRDAGSNLASLHLFFCTMSKNLTLQNSVDLMAAKPFVYRRFVFSNRFVEDRTHSAFLPTVGI